MSFIKGGYSHKASEGEGGERGESYDLPLFGREPWVVLLAYPNYSNTLFTRIAFLFPSVLVQASLTRSSENKNPVYTWILVSINIADLVRHSP